MITNIFLALIAALLLARVIIERRNGKNIAERMSKEYCAASEVENCDIVADRYRVGETIREYGKRGYELVQVIDHYSGSGDSRYQLFFTRKKIKNYEEE